MSLSNQAISADWAVSNSSIILRQVTNKFDGQTLNLENIILFAIELEGGKCLTNLDFKLKSEPVAGDLKASHNLPAKALQFPGKEISALLVADDNNLEIMMESAAS